MRLLDDITIRPWLFYPYFVYNQLIFKDRPMHMVVNDNYGRYPLPPPCVRGQCSHTGANAPIDITWMADYVFTGRPSTAERRKPVQVCVIRLTSAPDALRLAPLIMDQHSHYRVERQDGRRLHIWDDPRGWYRAVVANTTLIRANMQERFVYGYSGTEHHDLIRRLLRWIFCCDCG